MVVYLSSTTLQVNENKQFIAKKTSVNFTLSIKCHLQKVYNVRFHVPKAQNQVKLFYDVEDRAVVIGNGSKRLLGKLAMFYLFSMQVAQELFTV